MHLHFLSMINVNFDKQILNLTEKANVLVLSKLEQDPEGSPVFYNIAKSTVQRIKQTILWCSKISATFYVVKLT
jgi:hypothetical protein